MAAHIGCSSGCGGARPGFDFSYVDLSRPAAIEARNPPDTKMIWVETPTNPLLRLVDLGDRGARASSAASSPSPTTPSPAPMCSGRWSTASTSSCIRRPNISNGHSDMVGGVAVVGENAEVAERIAFLQNAVGAIAGPFDSFLALRG